MDKKIVEMKTPVGVVIHSVGKLARQLNVGDVYYKNATTPVEVQEVSYHRDGTLKLIVESMGLDRGLETIEECSGDEIVAVFFESENKYYQENSWGFLEEAAEHKGKKVKLNKPMRGDVKKYKVYVKNDKGNVVKVEFGDPNMEIKRDNPARRKNFRARHNCDNPGPIWKARYWACRFWSKESVSSLLSEEALSYGVLLEKNSPKDKKKWSACIAQAKQKFDVYPSAYANAWAAKCYKKKGGGWRKISEAAEGCGCDSSPDDTEAMNEYQFKINKGTKIEETPGDMIDQMINTKKVKDMEPQNMRINYLKGIFEEFKK